ncbi:MAG: putative FAD-dependent oxidoreductase LodB [Flaviaesturariibacter sp.]|nr:putative FAD-dependent oxidoreductase LodB [Flaviaesturariibacter sp.]
MKASFNTDVLIVGGGPAGASAALSLLSYTKFSVTIVEQSSFDGIRVGEHVDSSLFEMLDYLKISKGSLEEGTFIKGYSKAAAWGTDRLVSRDSLYSPANESYQLDREKFDLKLLREVSKRGGTIIPRTRCTRYQQTDTNEWQLHAKHFTKGAFGIKSRFLIDATGRQATVCRQLGIASAKKDTLVGVGAFLLFRKDQIIPQEIILEASEKGWWHCATLPGQVLSVTFFSDADIISTDRLQVADNWQASLLSTKYIKYKVGEARATGKPWIKNAFSQITDTSQRKNFMAVGDAASSFDPISSMGIGFAMNSGCNAARAINFSLNGDESLVEAYPKKVEENFKNYLNLRNHFYAKETRWNKLPFWERRAFNYLDPY